jgi:16S rRNA (guanine966-N2)-methyltransferase
VAAVVVTVAAAVRFHAITPGNPSTAVPSPSMRIVAGELRGRRLVAPDARTTRPTTDKVREAVFNALASLDVVVDARVLDLYAGSGALGIEALSRGAAHCTFVERERAAVRAIDENIATLGLRATTRVVVGDGIATAAGLDADLAFADPPYGFDDWPRLLRAVRAPLLVAEADAEVPAPLGWDQGRVKRYGRTWVTFLYRDDV